jgi:hypothetical protein
MFTLKDSAFKWINSLASHRNLLLLCAEIAGTGYSLYFCCVSLYRTQVIKQPAV